MFEFEYRSATIDDIPFLVETIVEAEKSGSNILSYSTIFGLSEVEVRKHLANMLFEEIDGCELSISSFLVAECDGQVVASLSAWVEGSECIPSSVLKGNLLNYTLPRDCIQRAVRLNPILQELHIDYIHGTIQKGAGYVLEKYRGMNLLGILTDKMVSFLQKKKPDLSEVYTQIYGSNIPAIRANEKVGFKVVLIKESVNNEICHYLPSYKKVLMKKEI
jgi:hypothetical protein